MSSNGNYRKLQTEELQRISPEEYKAAEKHPIVILHFAQETRFGLKPYICVA